MKIKPVCCGFGNCVVFVYAFVGLKLLVGTAYLSYKAETELRNIIFSAL